MDRNTNEVTLLLIHEGDKSHYVWTKNISRLMASKTSHYKKHICVQCFGASFDSQIKLDKHLECCMKNEVCRVELPRAEDTIDENGKVLKANNIMKFKNDSNEFKHPFHIIADFESTLLKVEEIDDEKSTKK